MAIVGVATPANYTVTPGTTVAGTVSLSDAAGGLLLAGESLQFNGYVYDADGHLLAEFSESFADPVVSLSLPGTATAALGPSTSSWALYVSRYSSDPARQNFGVKVVAGVATIAGGASAVPGSDLYVTGIAASVTPGQYTATLSDASTFNVDLTALEEKSSPNTPGNSVAVMDLGDIANDGDTKGPAATTVDVASDFVITQTSGDHQMYLNAPTVTAGARLITLRSGAASTGKIKLSGRTLNPGETVALLWGGAGVGWTPVGAAGIKHWSPVTPYTVDEYVNADNKIYIVVSAHTSAATVAADVLAGRLVEVSPGAVDVVERITATQASLAPGVYDLDSSGGAFSITLADTVGEWEFHNTARTFGTNNVTLVSGGTKTFTNPAGAQVVGDFVLDVSGQEVGVLHTEAGNTYRVSFAGSVLSPSAGPVVAGGVVFGNGTIQVQDVTNLFFDDATNRLGVGTNAPASKLTIEGDGFANPNNVGVRLTNSGASARSFMLAARSDGGAGGRFAVSDETAGAVRLTVGSNGFVGIGEEGPAARLHIRGDSNGNANQAATRYTNDGPGGHSFNVGTRGDGGAQRFFVSDETAGAERFAVRGDNGQTYINTSANNQMIAGIPNASLNIQAGDTNLGLNVRGNGGSSAVNIQTPTGGDSVFVSFKNDNGSAGAHKGEIGYVTFSNAVYYSTSSDARLKEDTGEQPAGLDELLGLKVRKYTWKRTGAVAEGFFAQELDEVVPAAVVPGTDEVDENGNLVKPWQVDYGKLTPILVKAVQQLSAKVDELTARMEALS
jgi:hypothetical protein